MSDPELPNFLFPAFVQVEVFGIAFVIVAEVFVDFAAGGVVVVDGLPGNEPAARPRTCVSAFVVDSHFILERVVVYAREPFDQMQVASCAGGRRGSPRIFR